MSLRSVGRPRVLDRPGTYSCRLPARLYRKLADLHAVALSYDPRASKSDVIRALVEVADDQDSHVVELEAQLRDEQRHRRELEIHAKRLEEQMTRTQQRLEERRKKDDDLRHRIGLLYRHRAKVQQLAAREARTRSGTQPLDLLWDRYGRDWRRVLEALDAVHRGEPPPGGAP